jgi:outer membrane protein insertion porin family
MLNGEVGYGEGSGSLPLPFFKNFFAGGVNSVRGYQSSSIGPRDQNGDPRGGNRRIVGNLEFLYPFPGLQNDRSVRMSTFVDGGMVSDDRYDVSAARYSAGLAVFWSSPVGPLKISVAKALNAKPGDRKQVFQFTFGGAF